MLSRNRQIEVNENTQTVPTIWVSHLQICAHINHYFHFQDTMTELFLFPACPYTLKEKIRHPALKWNVELNCMWNVNILMLSCLVQGPNSSAGVIWAIMDLNSVTKALIVSSCHETGVTGGKLVHWARPPLWTEEWRTERMMDTGSGRCRTGRGKANLPCCCWDEGQWQTHYRVERRGEEKSRGV